MGTWLWLQPRRSRDRRDPRVTKAPVDFSRLAQLFFALAAMLLLFACDTTYSDGIWKLAITASVNSTTGSPIAGKTVELLTSHDLTGPKKYVCTTNTRGECSASVEVRFGGPRSGASEDGDCRQHVLLSIQSEDSVSERVCITRRQAEGLDPIIVTLITSDL